MKHTTEPETDSKNVKVTSRNLIKSGFAKCLISRKPCPGAIIIHFGPIKKDEGSTLECSQFSSAVSSRAAGHCTKWQVLVRHIHPKIPVAQQFPEPFRIRARLSSAK